MGKKIKKKAPNPRKAHHRASGGSPKAVLVGSSQMIASGSYGDRVTEACSHYSKGSDEMNRILLKVRSSSMDAVACEHCREETVVRRGGKEKGKQPKKKGVGTRVSEATSGQNFIWVCLDCGRYFCGGAESVVEPYGHARRHAKQEHHQWAVRGDNPLISWCYACSSSVPVEMPDEVLNGDEAAVNSGGSLRGATLVPLDLEKFKGRIVRGLSNLGNTCFFNSVMQNLFAMDLLRDTLLSLDRPFGPLSMSLRMLFIETGGGADSKGVINPKALFGCISAKAAQFRAYQQQDSHELLLYLLDGLHMEETNARKASEFDDEEGKVNVKTGATVVDVIFGGQLLSTVSCMECGHISAVNEPFLDLSLPIPSRKPTSKPPPSKRANQTLRDKNKPRRFRGRGVSQVSAIAENQKAESTEPTSKSSESGIAVVQQTHDIASEALDYTWMDYLGDTESPDCGMFGAHESEDSIVLFSDLKQANESESSAQSVSELPTVRFCRDLTMASDICEERSCRDEVPHSCATVSGVILLPYKEQEQVEELTCLDINDRTLCFMDRENIKPTEISAGECTANSRCEKEDESFDGFGDLFNEPEVTSFITSEPNVVEDMDIAWCTGTTSESNLEELDNTNDPVSINGCLALFTKPELLSDEQAWYCEHCSEMLQKNREFVAGKLLTSKVSDQSLTVKSMVDDDELENKKLASNLHGNSAYPNNETLVSLPKDVAMLVEGHFHPCIGETMSQKSVNHAEGLQNSREISSYGTLHLAEVAPCNKENMDLETSQCLSTPTICENSQAMDDSSIQESDFQGINDMSTVGDDGVAPKVVSNSLQVNTNLSPNNPNKDSSQVVSRMRKKGLKPGKTHPAKVNKGQVNMVKRDATKKIFIARVPPVLTIHLKRFTQDGRGHLTKLSGHVSFQETFDLRPYMDSRCMEDQCYYRLIGVVEHSGSMAGGHYVAYVRGDGSGSRNSRNSGSTGQAWFYVSDAHVREVTLGEVLQSDAYILFYEKM